MQPELDVLRYNQSSEFPVLKIFLLQVVKYTASGIYIFLILFLYGCGATDIEQSNNHGRKINGFALESPMNPVDSTDFTPLHHLNVNSIAIIPYAFSRKDEPKVYFNNDHQYWGERLDGAGTLIDIAHQHGFTAMLKPHVWMHDNWIGTFHLETDEEWQAWEKSYSKYILAYAGMAETHHAEIFCIGTELKVAATSRPVYFRKLIREIRAVFSGKITYAANWDSYASIKFWDDLDFIGINAYFPLSQKENPKLNELKTAWEPILEKLKQFHLKFGKDILITEFGYRSVNKAAGNQWNLGSEPVNNALQARAYRAFFERVYPKDWIVGAYIWKWEFGNRDNDWSPSGGRRYSPQGKPASATIAHFYGLYNRME